MEFHPVLVTDMFGFIDVLIVFYGQKSKSHLTVTEKKTGKYNISQTIGANFTNISP